MHRHASSHKIFSILHFYFDIFMSCYSDDVQYLQSLVLVLTEVSSSGTILSSYYYSLKAKITTFQIDIPEHLVDEFEGMLVISINAKPEEVHLRCPSATRA